MSRSSNTELANPSLKYFEWNGESGGMNYYDKEKKEKIQVSLPFRFLVLDTLSTIKGFNDSEQSGYYSNEVRDTTKEILTVRSKKGLCAKGLYQQVIVDRNCIGAKYVQSVYIAYKEGKELVICNFQVKGAALSSWIEFRKGRNIFAGAIVIDSMTEGKKGKTTYQVPVFKMIESTPETETKSKELDIQLQEYLKSYFAKSAQETYVSQATEIVKYEPNFEQGKRHDSSVGSPASALPMESDNLPF